MYTIRRNLSYLLTVKIIKFFLCFPFKMNELEIFPSKAKISTCALNPTGASLQRICILKPPQIILITIRKFFNIFCCKTSKKKKETASLIQYPPPLTNILHAPVLRSVQIIKECSIFIILRSHLLNSLESRSVRSLSPLHKRKAQ